MTTLEHVLLGWLALSSGFALWRGMQWSEQVGTLTLERNMWQFRTETCMERLRDVEPREASFRQSLGFYADEETWAAPGRAHSPAFKDRGRIARDVLRAAT